MRLSELGWIIKKQSELQNLFECNSEFEVQKLGFSSYEKYENSPYKWGYKLAHKTRQLLGINQSEPIGCLRSLVEDRLFIPVVQSDLPISFAGATISNGIARGIVLNLRGHNENPCIRRNTLAHELGHLLWDPSENLNSLRVDTFDEIFGYSEYHVDPVEARANAFAAEFLAPREAVREFVINSSSDEEVIQAVCEHFGIGSGVARHQIQNHPSNNRVINQQKSKIPTNEKWVAVENFTSDYLPGAKNIPINRRGKFSYWVARSAIENLISFDAAGLYLGLDAPLDKDQAHSIVNIF
jgi:hypothetical protein